MDVLELIDDYEAAKFKEDWDALSPKERVGLFLGQALEYKIPKRQRTSINQNDNELPDDYNA